MYTGMHGDEDPESHGPSRVMAFATVTLIAVTVTLRLWLWTDRPFTWWLVPTIWALFLAGELAPVSIEFRRESHTFSFSSVPIVIALFYLPPQYLAGARMCASLIALGVVHRQPLYRLVSNLATHLVEVVVAAGMAAILTEHIDIGPKGWLVIMTSVVVGNMCGAITVTAAISIFQRKYEPALLRGLWLGGLSILIDIVLALLIVALARSHQPALWLMAPVVIFIIVLMRQFSAVTARHQHVELLYQLNRSLGEAVLQGDVIPRLLRESVDILHAEAAWLIQLGTDGLVRQLHLDPSGEVAVQTASAFDVAVIDQFRSSDTTILIRGEEVSRVDISTIGHHEAIAASLAVDASRLTALVVADRSGTIRSFDEADVTLLTTLAVHAAVVLRNVDLVDSLRAESERNEELATHDPLTGLPTRTLIHAHLQSLLDRDERLAVMLIDLDRFKEVNDTLGHQNGDLLLIEAGRRMCETVGEGDMIARLGGDEFAVLVRSAADDAELIALAEAIRTSLCQVYELADAEIEIGASVGVSTATAGSSDAATMLRQADVAMYAAKNDHLGVELYTPARDMHSRERLMLVAQLRNAIEQHQLAVHYQPLVDLQTGFVTGAEALVRWPREGAETVMPDEFIYVAENTGLIRPLTQLVLRECISQAAKWFSQGLEIRLSLNLSPRNLLEPDLAAQIAELLRVANLPARLIQLELTESTVMSDPAGTIGILRRLRATGVGLAIDDFGTGHSSLAYLTALPATELKIDKSFVAAMLTDPASRTVVRSIIDLGRNLGLEVLAEGIETPDQYDTLREMGCHLGQGYLFSRALPIGEFDEWLLRQQTARNDAPSLETTR